MTLKNKRDLWYVSGNKGGGVIFASPSIEIGEEHEILTDEIARLVDSDIDGAHRWIVVAQDGEKAVEKLKAFLVQCKHPKDDRCFSEDGLIEWCEACGALICDHHLRKYGKSRPERIR